MTRFLFFLLFFIPSIALSDSVYTWVDENGVKHYSTKAENPQAKVAELPEINRGDVDVAPVLMKNCTDRGGIDCSQGPDDDGSVVCYDGFRDAVARYRFHCSSPKIEIAEVSDLNENGGFSVFVRNTNSVVANNPEVIFKGKYNKKNTKLLLAGPPQIEAFGLAEFLYTARDPGEFYEPPPKEAFSLTCNNCSG